MKALLVIDVQNDFCPGGALAVWEGDQVVPVLNEYTGHFRKKGFPVFASQDWHPQETRHFQAFGGTWPVHCVQNTPGAAFHPGLDVKGARVISKGMDPDKDSYSAFQGFDEEGAPLLAVLRRLGVTELYIGGLATDFCVRATVLDALKEGFTVKVLLDACRPVEPVHSNEQSRVLLEMRSAGASLITTRSLPSI